MLKLGVLFLICVTAVYTQDLNSCENRCNFPYNSAHPCHCNSLCESFGNCCADYLTFCPDAKTSCENRCREKYDNRDVCHCDPVCSDAGNCCADFNDLCPAAYQEFSALADQLYMEDVNAANDTDYTLDLQGFISNPSTIADISPNKLFAYFNEDLFNLPTWGYFRDLLDNYIRYTGTAEDVPAHEETELQLFLDEVMASTVMKTAHQYLVSKGLASADYYTDFRNDLETIWFQLYTRSSGPLDSSGFEHVFAGEIKNNGVSGFHNWVKFYLEEKAGLANYHGYTNFKEPDTLGLQFEWDGYFKSISSVFVSRSPEFELALFTVCYKQYWDRICYFDMQGFPVEIQTWKQEKRYVGSAYVIA